VSATLSRKRSRSQEITPPGAATIVRPHKPVHADHEEITIEPAAHETNNDQNRFLARQTSKGRPQYFPTAVRDQVLHRPAVIGQDLRRGRTVSGSSRGRRWWSASPRSPTSGAGPHHTDPAHAPRQSSGKPITVPVMAPTTSFSALNIATGKVIHACKHAHMQRPAAALWTASTSSPATHAHRTMRHRTRLAISPSTGCQAGARRAHRGRALRR